MKDKRLRSLGRRSRLKGEEKAPLPIGRVGSYLTPIDPMNEHLLCLPSFTPEDIETRCLLTSISIRIYV